MVRYSITTRANLSSIIWRLVMTVTDEALLLDLLNSTPVVEGGPQDLLDRDWLRAHDGGGSATELHEARRARDVLQDLVRGAGPVDALRPLLDGVSYQPAIAGDGIDWTLHVAPARRLA